MHMVTAAEAGGATSELKFLVQADVAQRIRAWARSRLTPDPHGTGADGDEYETSTLYFDTVELDVLGRRGSYGRAKYRVRRYGQADVIYLERKLRRSRVLIKRRVACAIDALDRLTEGSRGDGWCGEWFERRLLLRRLRPVCQVSYRRMARSLDSPDGTARLTLDTALRVRHTSEVRFGHAQTTPFLDSYVIVEMKYRDRLPALCRQLVEDFALSPHPASKYRLGMTGLGQSGPVGHPSLLTRTIELHA